MIYIFWPCNWLCASVLLWVHSFSLCIYYFVRCTMELLSNALKMKMYCTMTTTNFDRIYVGSDNRNVPKFFVVVVVVVDKLLFTKCLYTMVWTADGAQCHRRRRCCCCICCCVPSQRNSFTWTIEISTHTCTHYIYTHSHTGWECTKIPDWVYPATQAFECHVGLPFFHPLFLCVCVFFFILVWLKNEYMNLWIYCATAFLMQTLNKQSR